MTLMTRLLTCRYHLSSKRDHVQGAVHETSRHRLGSVLGEHSVIHAVVSRHILTHGRGTKQEIRISVSFISKNLEVKYC